MSVTVAGIANLWIRRACPLVISASYSSCRQRPSIPSHHQHLRWSTENANMSVVYKVYHWRNDKYNISLIEQTCLIFTSEHSRSRHIVWCWGDFHIFSASEDIQPGDVGLCVTVLPSLGNADLDHLRTEMLSVKNNSSNKNNNKPKRVTFRWHFWTTIPCMVCP